MSRTRATVLMVVVVVVWPLALFAAPSSATLDVLPDSLIGTAPPVELGRLRPLEDRNDARPPRMGNPLWSIPLSTLTATPGRPIFSMSRRPAPGAVTGPRVEPAVVPVVAVPSEPERPPLALIGAVVGDSDAIAVFVDRLTQRVVRLRAGDSHAGWQLDAVMPREVTLRKAGQVETLALQRPGEGPAAPSLPMLPVPTAGDGSYVPFVPRSTPKNGESDGL